MLASNARPATSLDRKSGCVKVCTDKNILRLQFPRQLSLSVYGKSQFYKGLGKQDNPKNRKWAESIANLIQADLDHPDAQQLFDPTLEKYLGSKIGISKITTHPANKITLKDIWEDFAEYKFKSGAIAETTYKTRYKRTYLNWLTPYLDELLTQELAEKIAFELLSTGINRVNLKKLLAALKEACDRAIGKGTINRNFFIGLANNIKVDRRSKQLTEEEDYRNFTKQERDTIIQACRESSKPGEQNIADLVEFLFLTGCRLGEAFALRWNDIKPGWIVFDQSYSSETKITKSTKTDTIRIFRTKDYTRLLTLLDRLKSENSKPTDLIFTSTTGKQYNRFKLSAYWLGLHRVKGNSKYYDPGVVTRLANEGKISTYLKPSATRHTFITLQAQAGVDLKLLADSVGNSVDIIYTHYLGVDKDATIADI